MRNRDMYFSKEELYSRVWGLDSYGDYATVAVHINRLREEIEDNPSDSKHIITVWGEGINSFSIENMHSHYTHVVRGC